MAADLATIGQQENFHGYPVKITIFEGPLDLLLHLVRRQEVDIYEVELASVTDQYLQYLQVLGDINIELAGEFLVMATTLLLIKSRSLLPATQAEGEDGVSEEEVPTSEAEIKQRLEEYRLYKEAAKSLDESRKLRQQIFLRPLRETDEFIGGVVPLEQVSIFDMVAAVKEMLDRAKPEKPARLARVTVTVSQRIQEILLTLTAEYPQAMDFRHIVDEATSRLHIIVSFLALLELVRQQRVRVSIEAEQHRLILHLAQPPTNHE